MHNTQPQLYAPLGKRELEMLKLAVTGHSNKEITNIMNIKISTLYKMWGSVFYKLAANNSRQAIAAAQQLNIVHIGMIALLTLPAIARPRSPMRPLPRPASTARIYSTPLGTHA
ncbi:response regulator transcription factor [Teredinibacter purpureus]|uniref:response regulator transcription factor n=1 Tax=Teredinibacter purpureus TaxID=2731756 RepID=UPI0005F80ACB|nr:helix-turn-helix transcriptional regulator [Teredinibacter purpureus]